MNCLRELLPLQMLLVLNKLKIERIGLAGNRVFIIYIPFRKIKAMLELQATRRATNFNQTLGSKEVLEAT